MKKKLEVQTRNQLWKLNIDNKAKNRLTMNTQSKEKTLSPLDQSIKKIQSIIEDLKKQFKK